jgi:hypothetical protein
MMGGRGTGQLGCRGPFLHSDWRQGELLRRKRHVNVFEKSSAGYAANTIGGFEKIISGLAAVFASEGVGENEGLRQLTRANEKTSAIKIPITFSMHDFFTALAVRWLRTLIFCWRSVVNVRAERGVVNYT